MNRRRIKKQVKKLDDYRLRVNALRSLKLIRYWSNRDHENSKGNMKILTGNFWRNGKFLDK